MNDPARPSRQELVVPPRQSSLPLLLGSLVCASAGFGLVMFLGVGRSADQGDRPPVGLEAAAFGAGDGMAAATTARDQAPAPPTRAATDRRPFPAGGRGGDG
ncbi:MAG: hypothetical protein ACKOTB_14700, partial [Planctomycetia bacterium]